MKVLFGLIIAILFNICAFSQNEIRIETLVDSIDWEDCSESDIIFMFKDNIIQRENEETFGDFVGRYDLRNVVVGQYTTSISHIVVNKYNRQLMRISMIIDEKDADWTNPKAVDANLEATIKKIFGNRYKKTIEYSHATIIEYIWESFLSDNNCGATILITPEGKCAAVTIEKEISY